MKCVSASIIVLAGAVLISNGLASASREEGMLSFAIGASVGIVGLLCWLGNLPKSSN